MNVLAIDTSHSRGSVSIRIGGRGGSVRLDRAASHLTELGKGLSALLSSAGATVRDIDRVAIVTGPGSFTGLRVGMACVKGLYAARPFDVVVMTSLELLARQATEDGPSVSPMIDARKDEVYAALYETARGCGDAREKDAAPSPSRGLVVKITPCVIAPQRYIDSIARTPTVFVGSGAIRYRTRIEEAFGTNARFAPEGRHEPDTDLLCRIAEGLEPIASEDVVTLEPFYIRPEDVKLKPLRGVRPYDSF